MRNQATASLGTYFMSGTVPGTGFRGKSVFF